MTMHVNDAKRHGQKTPRKQIINEPMVTKTPAAASKMPRIDGLLEAEDGGHLTSANLELTWTFSVFQGGQFLFAERRPLIHTKFPQCTSSVHCSVQRPRRAT